MRKIKILTILLILFQLSLGANQIWAAEKDIEVKFEGEPLFEIENWAPGNKISKTFELKNKNKDTTFELNLELFDLNDPNDLADKIEIKIVDDNEVIYWNKSLKEINDKGQINLGAIIPKEKREFIITALVPFELGNEYQGTETEFNFQLEWGGDVLGVETEKEGDVLSDTGDGISSIIILSNLVIICATKLLRKPKY